MSEPALLSIPGRPGYFAGTDGKIYSVKHWRGTSRRVLAEGRDQDGYHTVQLSRGHGGRTDTIAVHRLMARVWLPPRPSPDHEVRHLDGVKAHNAPTNLAWGTTKDNAEDRERHGRTIRGERDGNAILTDDQVREIKATGIPRGSGVGLAKRFGVSQATISAIKTGRLWRHL